MDVRISLLDLTSSLIDKKVCTDLCFALFCWSHVQLHDTRARPNSLNKCFVWISILTT